MTQASVFGAPGPETFLVPRPQKMYLPKGQIKSAWQAKETPYANHRGRRSPAQKAGLAYQKRIGKFLSEGGYSGSVESGPWFAFSDDGDGRHYCQPDFLLDDPSGSTCVIVEVKIRWTSDAWWQLQSLYTPVVRRALGRQFIVPLCICRSYDPSVRIPEEVKLCDDLFDASPSAFNVLVVR